MAATPEHGLHLPHIPLPDIKGAERWLGTHKKDAAMGVLAVASAGSIAYGVATDRASALLTAFQKFTNPGQPVATEVYHPITTDTVPAVSVVPTPSSTDTTPSAPPKTDSTEIGTAVPLASEQTKYPVTSPIADINSLRLVVSKIDNSETLMCIPKDPNTADKTIKAIFGGQMTVRTILLANNRLGQMISITRSDGIVVKYLLDGELIDPPAPGQSKTVTEATPIARWGEPIRFQSSIQSKWEDMPATRVNVGLYDQSGNSLDLEKVGLKG